MSKKKRNAVPNQTPEVRPEAARSHEHWWTHPLSVSIIGRAAGTILAAVFIGTAAYCGLTRERPTLTGSVFFAPHAWPPELLQEFHMKGLESRIAPPTNRQPPDQSPQVRDLFEDILLFDYRSIDGVWLIAIKNVGTVKLSDVSLLLPWGTIEFHVRKDGEAGWTERSKRKVPVGDLEPGQRANITGWSATGTSLAQANQIVLSHSAGLGSLTVLAPAGSIARFVEGYWVETTVGLAGGVALVVAVLFVRRRRSIRRNVRAA